MTETARADAPDGIVIAEIPTARGPVKLYSPSLDDTEEILTILSGPATDLWKRLEEIGRLSEAERKAQASLLALASIAPQTPHEELVKRLQDAAQEARAVKSPATREQIETAIQTTIRQSGGAIRKALAVLLKLHPEQVGKQLPSARLGEIVQALRKEFRWDELKAQVTELVQRSKAGGPEPAPAPADRV